jgi:HSP20 family protein
MRERFAPFEQMDRMLTEMRRCAWSGRDGDRASSGPWSRDALSAGEAESHAGHALTLEESDDGFVVLADLPGFETEEIDLQYEDDVLRVEGTHEVTGDSSARSRTVRESITVPGDVVVDEITASYHNGVLEVRLPVDSSSTAHRIDIE